MMSIVSMNCIAISSMHITMKESSLGHLWQSHSRHPLPVSWLTSCCEPLCHSACPGTSLPQLQTCGYNPPRQAVQQSTPATIAMVTHHLHPPKTAPTAHDSTLPAEQTALHVTPVAPNAKRWDTGDQNGIVANHSN